MPLIRKDAAAPSPPAADASDLVLLTEGTVDQRWAAARRLVKTPGAVQALGRALPSEADPRVREAIFTSLVRVGGSESVEAVLPHLRSDDANIRTGALDALRAMAGAVRPSLPGLLDDPDADVRLLACEILRGLPSRDATPLLCSLLERERDVNVCAAAVEVLTENGDASALPALARCADRFPAEPFLVFSIKAASARIGGPSTAPRG